MLSIDRKLVFLDLETTSLDVVTARPWEIAMVERWPDGRERSTWIMVADVELCYADLDSLEVGRFDDRHRRDAGAEWLSERLAALWVSRRIAPEPERGLGSPVVVGSAVGSFDLPILAAMLARHGFTPQWYHHPIDLVTWTVAREAQSPFARVSLTERSYALSEAAGVPRPSKEAAHTAPGDVKWVRDWWDAVQGVVAS